MGVSAGSQTALPQESSTVVPGPQDKLDADLRVDDKQRIKGGSFNVALNLGAPISEGSPWAKQNKLSLGIAGSYLTEDAVPPAAASEPPSQLRLQVPPLAPRRTEWSIAGQFGLFGADSGTTFIGEVLFRPHKPKKKRRR